MSPSKSSDLYRLIFWPVLAPSLLASVGVGAVAPVSVIGALQAGASPVLASAIVAIAGVVALVVTVPVGVFIDRIGDKRAMTIATLSAALLFGLTVVALAWPSPASLALYLGSLLLRTPFTVGWNLARQSAIAEAVGPELRGRAMTSLGGTQRAGNLVGALLGVGLLALLPLWSVFAFCGLTSLVATGMLYVRRWNEEFDQAAKPSTKPQEEAVGVNWRAVGFAGVAISTLAVGRVAFTIVVSLWGLHLGWTEAQIALIVAIGSAIELVLMVPGGYLKDRLGRTPVLAACLAVFGVGYLLLPAWPTTLGMILGVVVMSVGNGFGAGINMTIGADLSPPVGRAKFLSIWAMFSQGGLVGGPLAISALLAAVSLPAAVTVVGVFATAGAVWSVAVAPITRLPGRTTGEAVSTKARTAR